MELYTLGFLTRSHGRGVAVVAAHNPDEAHTVLVSQGQLNNDSSEYGEVFDIKWVGCSELDTPTLLEEELAAIRIIRGEKGDTGREGSSIEKIEKTDTKGLTDVYTVVLTDGSKTTFEVTNGHDGDKTFYFAQDVPAKEWHITHYLHKHPSVTVIDSAGRAVIGQVIYDEDDPLNKVTLVFSAEFSGTATLN